MSNIKSPILKKTGPEIQRPKEKEYSLTEGEVSDLVNLHNLAHQLDYQSTLVKRDIQGYVDRNVRSRLKLTNTVVPRIDIQKGKIYIPAEAPASPAQNVKSETVSQKK